MPTIHFKRLPLLFGLSFGAFLGLVLTAFVLGERSSQKQTELVSDYGQSLATLVAQDASAALVGRNLLSLHALMSNIVALPKVEFASIYSVEQELLAQAGSPDSHQLVYTAPVPLHDSVGGYVSIAFDFGFESDGKFFGVLAATALLLLFMSLLALFEARSDVFVWPDRLDDTGKVVVGDGEPTEPQIFDDSVDCYGSESHLLNDGEGETHLVSNVEPPVHFSSDLILALPNYALLEKQLSDIVFSRRVAQFERQFKDVISLYHGFQAESPVSQGVYCLGFKSYESGDEAVFSAVCTAWLVLSLEQRHKIKFHLVAAVCSQECTVRLAGSEAGIFVESALVAGFLQERLLLDVLEGDYCKVLGFRGQYASLINRQVEQLQSHC